MKAQFNPSAVVSYTTKLVSGEADGIRLCRFIGRPLLTMIVPRERVAEAKLLPEIPSHGVYYLLDMKKGKPARLYAGQTTQGVARLEHHVTAKPWWDIAVMFLAPNDELPDNIIDGLEAMMIRDARQYAFCKVDNGNEPHASISPYDEGVILKTYEQVLWRMEVLGYCFSSPTGLPPTLEETVDTPAKRNPPFSFDEFGIAEGAILEFYDAKASIAHPEITASVCGAHKIRFRGRATSLSAAAKTVLKRKGMLRGPEYWTYNGQRLIDIYRKKYPAS